MSFRLTSWWSLGPTFLFCVAVKGQSPFLQQSRNIQVLYPFVEFVLAEFNLPAKSSSYGPGHGERNKTFDTRFDG